MGTFFPQSAEKAPFNTKTQRILLIMGVRGGQTTTQTRKRANNRRSSVTPTPPPNLLAPDSEDDGENDEKEHDFEFQNSTTKWWSTRWRIDLNRGRVNARVCVRLCWCVSASENGRKS